MTAEGTLAYPYSTRELIQVVRHLDHYPQVFTLFSFFSFSFFLLFCLFFLFFSFLKLIFVVLFFLFCRIQFLMHFGMFLHLMVFIQIFKGFPPLLILFSLLLSFSFFFSSLNEILIFPFSQTLFFPFLTLTLSCSPKTSKKHQKNI